MTLVKGGWWWGMGVGRLVMNAVPEHRCLFLVLRLVTSAEERKTVASPMSMRIFVL
jgi:hypothetical protein